MSTLGLAFTPQCGHFMKGPEANIVLLSILNLKLVSNRQGFCLHDLCAPHILRQGAVTEKKKKKVRLNTRKKTILKFFPLIRRVQIKIKYK